MENIPILNKKIEPAVIFSPKDYIEYKTKIEGVKLDKLPKNCIAFFEPSFLKYFEKTNFSLKKLSWLRHDENLSVHSIEGKDTCIVNLNYGAALSAIMLEELIAGGCENFIFLGSAGTLQKNIGIGSIVAVDSAIREEGVSYHYSAPSKYSNASGKLLARATAVMEKTKVRFFKGRTWTTDAFYRETIEKAKRYQKEGVLCVDMEAAALYAVAEYRKKHVLVLLYVSDSSADLKWNPQFHIKMSPEIQKTLIDTAIETLQSC